jgi:amino acid transporter
MGQGMATPTDSSPNLFVRQASGLVRSVSGFDAFVYNLLWLNIGLGIGVTFILTPFLFPGSQVLLATAVATIFCAIHVSVWALMSGAMPRSGGDYVFLSRIMHPVVGFIINWTTTMLNVLTIVLAAFLFVSDGVSTSLAILGSVFNSDTLLSWSATLTEEWPQFLVGAGAIIVLSLVMIFVGMGYFRLQRILFAIGIVGLLVAGGLLLFHSSGDVSAGLDKLYGANAVQRTIEAANAAGAPPPASNFTTFMGAIAIALFSMPWAFASAWLGGEVRHPLKMQMRAMVGSVLVGGLAIILFGWLLISRVTEPLLSASGYLFYAGGDSPISAPPYYQFFPSVLTGSRVIGIVIALGFIVWTFLWIPINLLSGSRNIFAWAFDRVVPEKLAEVDPRTHSPVIALSIVGVLSLIFWAVYTFTGVYFLTSFLAPSIFSLFVVDVAAIYAAYRRPDLLARAPAAMRRVAGVPLIVWLGGLAAIFFGVAEWFLLTNDTQGANSKAALVTWGVLYVTGGLIWFIARAVHKRRDGYDLSALYTALPPE